MPDDPSSGHRPGEQTGPSPADGSDPGLSRHGPDGPGASAGPLPLAGQHPAGSPRDYAITPGGLDGLDGGDWDQDAAMAAFMADLEAGYDLFASPIGLEPDDEDWPPPAGQDDWRAADGIAVPADDPAGRSAAQAGGRPGEIPGPVVPEWLDAGYLARTPAGPGQPRGGSGFASGDALDAARPGPALAGSADTAAGPSRAYTGLDDDELIGVLGAWQRNEAWAAAGKLSAVAELIRRRPGETSGVPGAGNSPCPGPSTMPSAWTGDGPGGSGGPGSGHSPGIRNGPATTNGAGGNSAGGNSAGGGIPAGYGKFCADELAVALAISRPAAERMLALAGDLATRLPLTARALHDGVIDAGKAQIIAETTRPLDDTAAAAAEAAVIPTAAGKTPGQLRAAIARAVLHADPTAARKRREQAQRDARVELWREDAGTAALCGFGLPPDEALVADQRIRDHALDLKAAGVPGTMDQLRVRAYLDTLLGQNTATARPHSAGTTGHDDTGTGTAGQDGTGTAGQDGTGAAGQDPCAQPRPRDKGPAGPGAAGADSSGTGTSAPSGGTGGSGGGQQASRGNRQQTGMAARINLTLPLATLLGLADRPGEATGFGPVDADLARAMAAAAATDPATSWCLTLTDCDGHPTAHGCARPAKPRRTANHERGPSGPASRPPQPTGSPRGRPRPSSTDSGAKPGTSGKGPPSRPGSSDTSPYGGYGTWRLRPAPAGPDLTVDLEPIPVTDCDHRHQTSAHDPSDRLRHLVQIRDGECTYPPCRRAARNCDFEHAIPWEKGGRTCGCNAGARCRHHHHTKQEPGWRLEQHLPGYHTWTTPSGRSYTTGPTTYPI